MATYQTTCKWCGKTFNTTNDFSVFGIGSKYCSKKCKQDAEGSKESKSSSSNQESTTTKTVYVRPEKSADQIKAEAEVERMERDENASQPWKFDSNFYSVDSISKISYPDTAEDVEKTVLRITKTAVEKIKSVINTKEIGVGEVQVGTKDFLKPYSGEFQFVDTCIEKANEGIKKLRRFEGNTINAMITDCQDSLDDLKNKWYVQLIEQRDKKKKKNIIVVVVLVVLVAAMMIALAANA